MWTKSKHGRRWAAALGVAAGGLLLGGAIGCEQRVVGTQNPWSGGHGDPIEFQQVSTQPPQKKGPLQTVGDALFGWMGGDEQPQAMGTTVPLEERMGQPTESASPNVR